MDTGLGSKNLLSDKLEHIFFASFFLLLLMLFVQCTFFSSFKHYGTLEIQFENATMLLDVQQFYASCECA